MSILDVKDRIPTEVLENGAVRYGVYDESGNLLRYEYMKREDEPIEEGTPVNKRLFDIIDQSAIGYNVLDEYEDVSLGISKSYEAIAKSFNGLPSGGINSGEIVPLDNGNAMILYGEIGNSNYMSYEIRTEYGEIVKAKTLLSSGGACSYIKAILLKNGNIFVSYSEGSTPTLKHMILDQEGNVVRASVNTSEYSYAKNLVELDNENVLIIYSTGDNSRGVKAIIIKPNGSVFSTVTLQTSTTTAWISIIKQESSYWAFYNDVYAVFDVKGNFIQLKTGYSLGNSCVIKNRSGNYIHFGYSVDTKFVITDEKMNFIKEVVLILEKNSAGYNICDLGNDQYLLYYTNDNKNREYYCVINGDGDILVDPVLIMSSRMGGWRNSAKLKSGTVLISSKGMTSTTSYVIAIGLDTEIIERKYNIDEIGYPNEAQKLNVLVGKQPVPNLEIYNGFAYYKNPSLFDSETGNVITFFSTTDVKFAIYNKYGEISQDIISTNSNADSGSGFGVSLLENNNIFLAFSDVNNSYKGTFKIIDKIGNEIKLSTIFRNASTGEINVIELDNGNVMLVYVNRSSTATYYGYYAIYDENGNVVKSDTVFLNGETINKLVAKKLKNGNVFVGVTTYSGYVAKYMIIDSEGNVVKELTTLSENSNTYIGLDVMEDGNVLFAMVISSTYVGQYAIIDENGNIVKNPTNYTVPSSDSVGWLTVLALRNGNVAIAQQDRNKGNAGVLYIYNKEIEEIEKMGYFEGKAINYMSGIAEFEDGSLFISYYESANQKVKANIVPPNGKPLMNGSVVSNKLNDIEIDTIIKGENFYELVYLDGKYVAQEVRV